MENEAEIQRILFFGKGIVMKRVGPKRVSVFEAGAGDVPYGAIWHSNKAENIRKGRSFVATDIKLLLEEDLAKRGQRVPSNLKLVRNCSVAELKKLPSASKDIIFESFFLNAYSSVPGVNHYLFDRVMSYLKQVKRVIKPSGRIIMIHGYASAEIFAQAARSIGLKSHIVILSQKMLSESLAVWIRKRATLEVRKEMLSDYVRENPTMQKYAEEFAKRKGLSEPADADLPVALILRKSSSKKWFRFWKKT